jgi:drug/metabolite transporter (DMT)-like permease
MSATQLKVIQEVISLSVFAIFAAIYLRETPTWRTAAAFLLIVAAVALIRGDSNGKPPEPHHMPRVESERKHGASRT